MPADRDRLSYDKRQQYRTLVAQQGRVTVPADFNEAQEIFGEEQRYEALDIVGPSGTPDDGYKISLPSPDPNFDLNVGAGTMYVGGVRVFLTEAIRYFAQPDWIDPPPPPPDPQVELIYLFLQEQEISAVEDQSLKDRALGGPDTTQRTRLLQHIVRTPADGRTCADALIEQLKQWAAQGLTFHPATMRLESAARLLVGFDNAASTPDPCDPTAVGGYLGAENQLIRVRVTAPGQLVWGFDNASFLYRVDVVDNQTVRLQSPPVDAFHQPRAGQAIELLRSEATLSNGEFTAYDLGRVDVLAQPYNSDAQTIRLPAPLTADLIPPDGTPRLFLRVWEESKPFDAEKPVSLGSTGVNVTLSSTGAFHAGDFWAFAVRPSSPAEVYPARYTTAAQPADGPRLWACPLAVIGWTLIGGTGGNIFEGAVLEDCRNPFDNLVDITKRKSGGCCTLLLTPSDKTTLAQAIDQLAGKSATICLAPGTYALSEPLLLNAKHSGITIEGCRDEVAITAVPGKENSFLHGMFVLDHANDVTLRELSFHLPLASAEKLAIAMKPDELRTINSLDVKRLLSGIGIRAFACAGLTIEDCRFGLQPPEPSDNDVFETAILLGGACDRLTIRDNRFAHAGDSLELASNHYGLRFGIVMAPVSRITPTISQSPTNPAPVLTAVEGSLLPATLTQGTIAGNFFSGVSAAAILYGDLGDIRLEDNTVRECASGVWLFASRSLAFLDVALPNRPELRPLADAVPGEPVIVLGAALARGYPWPGALSDADVIAVNKVPVPGTPVSSGTMLARGLILHNALVAMEREAFGSVAVKTRLALVCAENVLDGFSGTGTAQDSRTGLVLWGEIQDQTTSALINGNQIRSTGLQGGFPTMAVVFVARTTITGNLVLNEGAVANKNSLIYVPLPVDLPVAAVTGNVFRGAAQLPPRPGVPAPVNVWDVFNTIVT